VLLGVSAVVYVAVVAVLVAGLAHAPTRPSHRKQAWTIGAAGVATILTLLVILGASVAIGHDMHPPRESAEMTVKVIGHQWWWELQYPGHQPNEMVVTANELHIPVRTRVLVELSSRDVIHSFWVPALHGKRDLIPGHDSSTVIEAEHPGLFHGQCAEFCGVGHARMSLLVVAEDRTAFSTWLSHQREAARSASSPQSQRGHDFLLGNTCPACHTLLGTPAGGAVGPDLTHFASRRSLGSATRANDVTHLKAWIRDPSDVKPGVRMPGHAFTEQELDDLIAYLGDLQ
jgi:cytochrome c oxidase subunit 2